MKRFAIAIVLSAAILPGCAKQAPPATVKKQQTTLSTPESPVAVIGNTDACATRLHDICGAFLLYISQRNDLPASLAELAKVSDEELIFSCPVSNQPYVYAPAGVLLPEHQARIILYDPAPSHLGYREAIVIADPVPGQVPLTKIIALPESFFLMHPPEDRSRR